MSKHHHDDCCYPSTYGYGAAGYATASGGTGFGLKWIYALLILIVIVLQFGKTNKSCNVMPVSNSCEDGAVPTCSGGLLNNQMIDNSVLFIIVVFLLIICAGCLGGSGSGTGSGGSFGGYGC